MDTALVDNSYAILNTLDAIFTVIASAIVIGGIVLAIIFAWLFWRLVIKPFFNQYFKIQF